MPRYKIHIDKPLPDPSKVAQYRDFDTLYKQYQTATRFSFWQNLYHKPIYFASLVAILAVGFLVFEAAQKEHDAAFIQPPVPPKNIPFAAATVADTMRLPYADTTGIRRIFVPEEAFVDANGQVVSGKVELRYREFKDAADLFIGGIPMQYDSAELSYTLESAGMVEVLAYQNGEPIFLKEDKELEIEYYAPTADPSYSVYYLDTIARNWEYVSKDQIIPLVAHAQQENPELRYIKDVSQDTFVTRAMGMPPQQPGRPFSMAILNAGDFEMLTGRSEWLWEYMEYPGEYVNPWKKGLLRPQAQALAQPFRVAGVYELTIVGSGEKIIARLITDFSSLSQAETAYQARFASYERAMATYTAAREADRRRIEAREVQIEKYRNWVAEKAQLLAASEKGWCYRRFRIKKLGITQLGRLLPLTENIPLFSIRPQVEDQSDLGQQLQAAHRPLYLVLPQRHTLIQCEPDPDQEGQFLIPDLQVPGSVLWTSSHEEEIFFVDLEKTTDSDFSASQNNQIVLFGKLSQSYEHAAALKALLLSP